MSRSPQRQALILAEVVGLLPVIAAVLTMGYLTINRVEDMRNRESAGRQDDAMLRDIVRRIQEDAAPALEANIAESIEGSSLVLRSPGGSVTYTAGSAGVERLQQAADGRTQQYGWKPQHMRMTFKLEAIGGRPRIAWILATIELPIKEGPELFERLSAAAVVGSGGAP